MSRVVTVNAGYITGRTKARYRDRLLELDVTGYLTKMTMSHLVMKTFINVCLSELPTTTYSSWLKEEHQ